MKPLTMKNKSTKFEHRTWIRYQTILNEMAWLTSHSEEKLSFPDTDTNVDGAYKSTIAEHRILQW